MANDQIVVINNDNIAEDALTFSSDGSQAFAYSIPEGDSYSVSIQSTTNVACVTSGGGIFSGTMANVDLSLSISCATSKLHSFFVFVVITQLLWWVSEICTFECLKLHIKLSAFYYSCHKSCSKQGYELK